MTELTFTTAPWPAANMRGSTLRVVRTATMRFTERVASHCSSVMARKPPVRTGAAPTLFTNTSIRSPARSAKPSGAPDIVRSAQWTLRSPISANAASSGVARRAPATTRAPSSRSLRLTASPIPRPAPVTTATLPSSSSSICASRPGVRLSGGRMGIEDRCGRRRTNRFSLPGEAQLRTPVGARGSSAGDDDRDRARGACAQLPTLRPAEAVAGGAARRGRRACPFRPPRHARARR